MGNRIYGCDDCLAVCPWNKFAQAGREAKLAARDVARAPALAELARLDDAAFRALFAKTAVKRTGRDRFVRNVLIAIGNSGDRSLAPQAERLLADASPLVRGAAVWALGRLDPARLDALAPAPCRRDRSRRRRGVGRRRGRDRDRLRLQSKIIREGETSWPHSRAAPCLPDLPQPPRCSPSAPSRHGRSATFP